jgi:hypothetical protein
MNNYKLKDVFCLKATGLVLALFLITGGLYADPDPSPFGADAVPDLYAASTAGPGGFTTSTGGAPVSALNPAQGGDARRMIFDVSYLTIMAFPSLGKQEDGFMQAAAFGALFPTRYGVFGGSLRYIGGFEDDQFIYFPINPTFGGNLFASKELYPGMSLGLGFNFGFGAETTLSGNIGFRYNTGNSGILKNFTIGVVLRSLGVSYFPTWLTLIGGISFDLIHVEGAENKSDPFVLGFAADVGFHSIFYPDYFNLTAKAGLKMTIAEIINISASWPGGSGFNLQEVKDQYVAFPIIPSIGLSVKLMLPSGGERIAGGRLPSDGDLVISGAFKPLYEGITAIGGGISWYAGVADTRPPSINLEYPETAYFSPNNDGKKDAMEIPVSITDQGYVTSWKVEIKDAAGNVVRVIENKEQRFESFNAKEFFSRLVTPKRQVEMPSAIRWDGLRSTGELAADGRYSFTITATDDSGNTVVTPVYEVVIRNRPPEVSITAIAEAQRIFDPKGSTRSTITFTP